MTFSTTTKTLNRPIKISYIRNMKLFAAMLAIFIISLTIQPTIQFLMSSDNSKKVCSDICCQSKDSCSNDSNSQTQSSKDCCPGGICNPFQVCTCCCGGIVGRPSLARVISSIKTNHNPTSQNNPVLGFRSDCYHPPEAI
jgi:hypothetical protein